MPGYTKPLYILPFDPRASIESGMFGWTGTLSAEQTARIAATKRVIYDGFTAAVAGGVPKEKAGLLVDERFGAGSLRDAGHRGYLTCAPAVVEIARRFRQWVDVFEQALVATGRFNDYADAVRRSANTPRQERSTQ